jgi:hypothetical protein
MNPGGVQPAGDRTALLAVFGPWLGRERGLSPVTVPCYSKQARYFLAPGGGPEAVASLDAGKATACVWSSRITDSGSSPCGSPADGVPRTGPGSTRGRRIGHWDQRAFLMAGSTRTVQPGIAGWALNVTERSREDRRGPGLPGRSHAHPRLCAASRTRAPSPR